ncbi:unnamed protein product [Closterium sp. NIES-53]
MSTLEIEIATRGVFGTEEHPLPRPALQHLQGILRGTGVGTFDAPRVPRPYTKEKFMEIYSHRHEPTKKLTVAQEEELRQRSLAESRGTDTHGWGTASGGKTGGRGTAGEVWGASREDQRGKGEEEEAKPPFVPLGHPPRCPASALPPPDIQPHRDPWDTIDWGYEPSTPQHTVYGPDLELREPTFVPGTIPGTNILYSIILDRDFLALMLTTGNDEEEEGEEAAAEADEDPEAAHTRYKRTSGLRATDGLWHQRLGHPSRVTQKNCIEAGVFAPGALLRPDGSEVRSTIQPRNGTVCPEVGTNRYPKLHKVYRDFLNVGHCGIDDELYTLTFVEVRTCYVWIVNVEARSSAYDVFRLWLAHAQQ